ncbi:MAG: ABC transporter permease [Chloroflexi bacterium]|nr:ABC transporter permease [Chloroflexota bacterium]
MVRYIFRRLLALLPTVLGISLVVFIIMHLIPGDTISAMIGTKQKLTEAQMASLRAYFGLDRPLWEQYVRWLYNAIQGNFGISIRSGIPVTTEILSRVPMTLELTLLSVTIGLFIGIPLGVWSSVNQGKLADWLGRTISMMGLAMPSFWLGTLIIYVLSVFFHYLPNTGNFVSLFEDPLGNLKQIIFPALTLGFSFSANILRTTRSAMLEEINKDYAMTARAKGTTKPGIIWRHCFRNALIPIITLIGLEIGGLFGGAVIVENIFAMPGLGRLLLNAIQQRDYALIQGSIVFVATMFVLVNLLADLTYAAADPRIRYE